MDEELAEKLDIACDAFVAHRKRKKWLNMDRRGLGAGVFDDEVLNEKREDLLKALRELLSFLENRDER